MNVQFLERSISPLYPRAIDRGDSSNDSLSKHSTRLSREILHPNESPARARPQRTLLPVNLDDAHFSLQCGFSAQSSHEEKTRPDGGSLADKQDHNSSFLKKPLQAQGLENTNSKRITESIPISRDSMMRTSSELQMQENEAIADYRDHCMYVRILNGMSEQNQSWTADTIDTIRHIMETRREPVDQQLYSSSYAPQSGIRHSITNPLAGSPETRKKTKSVDPMQESLPDEWPSQARLAPLTDDPVSSLYNAVDLDLSTRLSLFVAHSVGDVSPREDGSPCGTTSEGKQAPLPLYVSFEACPISVDEDALFEMDDM